MAEEKKNFNPFLEGQTVRPAPPSANAPRPTPSVPLGKRLVNPPEKKDETPLPPVRSPESRRTGRLIVRSLVVLLLILLIGGGVFYFFSQPTVPEPQDEEVPVAAPLTEVTTPTIAPEPTESIVLEDTAAYESENFKAGEIVIGGEAEFLVDEEGIAPLTLENIRGETFTEKNKQEVKLVVTWSTNKLSQASVRYSKGIGQPEKSLEESDYSYNHSLIISGLDPASTYLYTIDAVDRYGNRVQSDPHAVFTGARTVSLFDLIAGAIGDVFGWAVSDR